MTASLERMFVAALVAAALVAAVTMAALSRLEDEPGGVLVAGSLVLHRAEPTPLGLVAVGFEAHGRNDLRPSIWVRRDERRWERLGTGLDGGQAWDVAAGPAVVAVGSSGRRPAVWRLDERAGRWEAALDGDTAAVAPGETSELTDVVSGHGRLVAVGATLGDRTATPLALVSTDGRLWLEATVVHDGDGATLRSVTAGPGGFVAAGTVQTGDRSRPATWRSPDGRAWQPAEVELDETAGPAGGIWVLGADDDGYVAFGRAGYASAVWVSGDGDHWELRRPALPAVDGEPLVTDLAPAPGGGFLAAGRATGLGDRQTGFVWSSPDGVHWRDVPIRSTHAETGYSDLVAGDGWLHGLGGRHVGSRVLPVLDEIRL